MSGRQSERKCSAGALKDDKLRAYDKLSVFYDYEDRISDISRLEAELVLSEWERGSTSRDYLISDDDYDWVVESMFDDYGYEFKEDDSDDEDSDGEEGYEE